MAFEFTRPAAGAETHLDSIVVKPHGAGLIQQVANVLASPVLQSPVTLSTLLGSLDEHLLFDETQVVALRPIQVDEYAPFPEAFEPPATRSLCLAPVPDRFAANTELVPAGPTNLEYTRIVPPSGEQVAEWLEAYPKLRALGLPIQVTGPEPALDSRQVGDWIIKLIWSGGPSTPGVTQWDWTAEQLDEIHAYGPDRTSGVVLPAVGGNTEAQDLLVAWWLVLYSFSMLARYYPKEWTEMLDVDASRLAVPLEHLLSVAHSKIPALIAT
ncbi:MAG TPA: YaaC family protein, partial [Acidimicrobiales bacterium]|nr:YaaC family protein [Acidimicrobiales bacterium]